MQNVTANTISDQKADDIIDAWLVYIDSRLAAKRFRVPTNPETYTDKGAPL